MGMWPLLARRLAHTPVVLVAVTLVTFVLFRYVGDPVLALAPDGATREERDELKAALGLDRSVVVQFGGYAARLARGDLGQSYQHRRPVAAVIAERVPASLGLALAAGLVTLTLGVPLGMLAAVHEGSWLGTSARALSALGAAVPSFVTAVALILLFSVGLGVAPAFGGADATLLGAVVLPALSLGTFQAAALARVLQAALTAALGAECTRAARARGATAPRVLYRHALPVALVPVVALLGVQAGSLVAFSVAVESIFQWPGLGSLFVDAVRHTDIPLIAGCVLGTAGLFLVVSLVVDLLAAACDPRVRDAGGGA